MRNFIVGGRNTDIAEELNKMGRINKYQAEASQRDLPSFDTSTRRGKVEFLRNLNKWVRTGGLARDLEIMDLVDYTKRKALEYGHAHLGETVVGIRTPVGLRAFLTDEKTFERIEGRLASKYDYSHISITEVFLEDPKHSERASLGEGQG
jgi:hypothetical protein